MPDYQVPSNPSVKTESMKAPVISLFGSVVTSFLIVYSLNQIVPDVIHGCTSMLNKFDEPAYSPLVCEAAREINSYQSMIIAILAASIIASGAWMYKRFSRRRAI